VRLKTATTVYNSIEIIFVETCDIKLPSFKGVASLSQWDMTATFLLAIESLIKLQNRPARLIIFRYFSHCIISILQNFQNQRNIIYTSYKFTILN